MLKSKGVLTYIQKSLLIELGKIPDADFFYLTGGSALAEFFWGHRRSYDLDVFTIERDLIVPFSRTVEEHLLRSEYEVRVIRRFESFVEFEIQREGKSVRLHLAYDSPNRFEEPWPSELGMKVNDYRDLVADKLLTFFGRWKHRDAVDLFFILQNESFENLARMAKQKDPGFDLYWFSMALQEIDEFPDEIGQWHVDMLIELNVRELKETFRDLSREVMNSIRMSKSEDET